jgi:hypothetical protein
VMGSGEFACCLFIWSWGSWKILDVNWSAGQSCSDRLLGAMGPIRLDNDLDSTFPLTTYDKAIFLCVTGCNWSWLEYFIMAGYRL